MLTFFPSTQEGHASFEKKHWREVSGPGPVCGVGVGGESLPNLNFTR